MNTIDVNLNGNLIATKQVSDNQLLETIHELKYQLALPNDILVVFHRKPLDLETYIFISKDETIHNHQEVVYDWLKKAGKQRKICTFSEKDSDEFFLWMSLMQEELKETKDAFLQENEEGVRDGLADLLVVLNNLSYLFYNFEYATTFSKVIASNNTKFCKSEQEAIDTVKAYQNGTHPNKRGVQIKTTYCLYEDVYVIHDMRGKIMKSINFKDTNEV